MRVLDRRRILGVPAAGVHRCAGERTATCCRFESRPLTLTGATNPAGYAPAEHAPRTACAWDDAGAHTAGSSIPAGALRGLGSPAGQGCAFEVRSGREELTSNDYPAKWALHPIIYLQPGDEIITQGCAWVPADKADLPLIEGTR